MKSKQIYEGVIYKRTLIAPQSITDGNYGKVYIGQTDNWAERQSNWKKPNTRSYGGKKLTEARDKYGIGEDAWKTEIIEKIFADSAEELKENLRDKETEYIKRFDSVVNGFNGSYGSGMQGMKHTVTAKEKISEHHRHYQTEEAKRKISASLKGRTVSLDTRKKISGNLTGLKRTSAQRAAQSARLKGKEPKAASKALKEYCIKNGHGPTKGIKQSPKARANMKKAQQARGKATIMIFPDGREKLFSTMLDAAKAAGVGVGSVHNCIKSGGTTKKGYKFKEVKEAA